MAYRGDRWSLAAALMVGMGAVAVVVAAIAVAGGRSVATPTPSAGTLFTPRTVNPTPVPKAPLSSFGYSAVDDPSAHQLVLFGGVDSYDTTWLWDGRRWSLAHPPLSPPGRFGAAAAYDPLTGVVMLYGGRLGPGDVVDDTWAWDGSTWRELDAGTGNPPAGEGSVMAWDSALSEMVLVTSDSALAGETWLWNGNRWLRQPRGDPPFAGVAMAVDPLTHVLLAAGCCAPGQGALATWEWNGSAWLRVSTRAEPPAAIVGLALDPASGRLLAFSDPASAAAGSQTWSWTGMDWMPLPGAPLAAFPEAEVSDVDGGHVVILGSVAQGTQGAPQPVHIWSWNGSSWDQRG
jgi:hypothetical protein